MPGVSIRPLAAERGAFETNPGLNHQDRSVLEANRFDSGKARHDLCRRQAGRDVQGRISGPPEQYVANRPPHEVSLPVRFAQPAKQGEGVWRPAVIP